MALSNFSKELLPHAGKWVAMTPDRKKILASGPTIEHLDGELDKLGINEKDCEKIIISKIPSLSYTISP